MSVTAKLDQASIQLDAGGSAVIPLQIRNDSDIVEGYTLAVVGVPAGWATLDPESVSLYPGDTTTATLTFHPPRSSALPAGSMQFGVRVVPTEHPADAVVPEGVVEVLPFLETTAELVPRTTRGRRGATHRVAVDNRGNVPLAVVLTGTPGGDALLVQPRPEGLTVQPGQAAFVDVRVRPVRRLWKGQALTHPFGVTVTPRDGTIVSLDGSHVQDAVLPKWWLRALLAVLGLLVLLAVLWFALLKPAISSAAEDAVAEPLAATQADAAAAKEAGAEQAAEAGAAAAGAQKAATEANAAADKASVLVGVPRAAPTVVEPVSQRLQVATPLGRAGTARYAVAPGASLALSDLVLQNPQGDFGRVTLMLGKRTLLSLALENFRDLDYHFVAPIRATDKELLVLAVQCRTVGRPPAQVPAPTSCDTALYFGGELTRPAPVQQAAVR
ncbi:MAG: hypothetical protein JWM64_2493 [Frankiales bacterium]|nr:hypothetical protein [Frankiales bacterium]